MFDERLSDQRVFENVLAELSSVELRQAISTRDRLPQLF